MVRPKPLDNLVYGYLLAGKTIWHCRVHAVAALFNDVIGWPVRLARPAPAAPPASVEGEEKSADGKKNKKKANGAGRGAAPPDPEVHARAKEASIVHLWEDTLRAETSYPLGKNLSWHDGVHLHPGQHLDNDDVLALGPGQLALARMGAPTPFGDTSFVLLEHWIDPVSRKVLTPPSAVRKAAAGAGKSPAEDQRKKLVKERALRFTRSTCTSRRSRPTSRKTEPPSRKALLGGSSASGRCPCRRRGSWCWDRRTSLRSSPGRGIASPLRSSPRRASSSGRTPRRASVAASPRGTPLLALPHRNLRSNVESWSGAAPMATIPTGRKLCFFNPLDGSILALEVPLAPEMGLSAGAGGALAVCKASPDGGAYVAINAFKRPGYEGSGKDHELTEHGTIRLTSAKAKLYLDTIGEGDKARFARTASVKLAASTEAPIELRIKEQGPAGKTRVADRLWVDLVPCVLLTADERAKKEGKLKDDVALAIDVKDRLEKRQSCLFGVKVGAHDEWIVDDHGLLVPNQAPLAKLGEDARVVTFYPEVKGQGKARSLGTPGKGVHIDSDSPALFKVRATPDIAVSALEIFEVSHRTFALVEVMFAVPESALTVSTAEVDRVKKLNQQRKPLADKLLKREVVSFLDLDDESGTSPPGRSGGLAGTARARARGFISRSSRARTSSTRASKARLTPSWRCRDRAGWSSRTAGRALHGRAGAEVPPGARRAPRQASDRHSPPGRGARPRGRGEAGRVAGLLPAERPSALADHHRSQAGVGRRLGRRAPSEGDARSGLRRFPPWVHRVRKRAAREKHDNEARQKEAKEILQAFQWWRDEVKLPGIPDKNAVFFYHPLRFIEWLRTGLEITIAGLPKPKEASIKIKLQDQEIPLEYDEISGAFSFRTVLGEVVQGQFAKLTLESGVTTDVKRSRQCGCGAGR